MQFLRWTSTNNNRWSSWLFIVLWWPGVYTGHSHTASRQGEGHKQHLKKPCKGLRSKRRHIYCTTHTRSWLKRILDFYHSATTGLPLLPSLKGCFTQKDSSTFSHSFASAHPEFLWERAVMEISTVIIPGDYMLMYSRLFVGENCIVVISVTPELRDATWQTSSSALRCPPRIYIFITTREGNWNDITAHTDTEQTPSTWEI